MRKLLSRNRTQIAEALERRSHALALAEVGLERSACRYGYEYERGLEMESTYNKPLHELARTFALRAALHAIQGDLDLATRDCVRIVRLAQTMEPELGLVNHVTRESLDRLATRTLEVCWGLGESRQAMFAAAAAPLLDETLRLDLPAALRQERALGHVEMRGWPDREGDDWKLQRTWKGRRVMRVFELRVLESFGTMIEAAELPYPEGIALAEKLQRDVENSSVYRLTHLIEILQPELTKILISHAQTIARLRTAAICLELAGDLEAGGAPEAAFARLPQTHRTDPYTGADFRLVHSETALTVYSVGMNGHDNGGVGMKPYNPDRDPAIADDIGFSVPLRAALPASSVGAGSL